MENVMDQEHPLGIARPMHVCPMAWRGICRAVKAEAHGFRLAYTSGFDEAEEAGYVEKDADGNYKPTRAGYDLVGLSPASH